MIKKTAIILIGVVTIVSVLAAGCTFNVGTTTPSPSPTNTYDSAKGFTIKYPSDWVKDEPASGPLAVLFALPTNNATENLNVQVQNLSAADTLGSVTDAVTSGAQNYSDFKQIDVTNTTLAGNPAYKIVYTATVNGDQLKLLQTWTVKNGKAYIITYKAAPSNYDTYASTAQQMIDSFQIK
ncbi:MAG: PsbP-related protein [Halobacteriota archaeon]|jgi:serine/threonine-protein kinase